MKTVKLGDVCNILNGYAFKSDSYVEEGIRVIRIANVQKGYIEDNNPVFYPLDSKGLERYRLKEQDLLMSLTGNVGRVALIEREMLPAALNQRVACLRLKSDTILRKYLFHLLNSNFFEQQCMKASKGVAQKNISTEWIKEYEIPLYSIEKQQEIIRILDKTRYIISAKTKEICMLDNLIKARFVEMFGDVKYGTERWGGKLFKDITINLDSKRKPVKDADRKKMQGIYPYYGATGIVDYVNDYRQDGEFLLISEDGKALELRSKPIAFLASGKIWVNNHAHVQQCTDECNMVYLMYHINFMDISIWVTGIDQKKLNRANLDTIPIALPPIELQEQFADFVNQVYKSLRKESKVVQTKKQYGDFSLTALSFASISIFSG